MVVVHGSLVEVEDCRQGEGLSLEVKYHCREWSAIVGSGAPLLRWRIVVGGERRLFANLFVFHIAAAKPIFLRITFPIIW